MYFKGIGIKTNGRLKDIPNPYTYNKILITKLRKNISSQKLKLILWKVKMISSVKIGYIS